jgi:CelD/BcsL family acetyltransferase involved in cellulose biosynthesis
MNAAYISAPAALKCQLPVISAEHGGAETVDQFANEWRELCAEAADDQPFYRPEWIRAYLRAFDPKAKVVVITARFKGRLCLILPLIEETGSFSKIPVRKLRVPVNCYAGRFDAVCSPGSEGDAAIRATWEYLKNSSSWDLLQFRDALEGSTIGRIAALAQADGFRTIQLPDKPSPYVPVPVDPELLKQLPVNTRLRRELKHVRRQLADVGPLNFYRVEAAEREQLDRFYELEASGWKGQQSSAIICKQIRPFFDEIAESTARFGYFTLYVLELKQKLIAAQYGFTYRSCYYSVTVAYDEDFKEFSPGHLIIEEILRDCCTRGIRVFDTTGQNQEWKMRWTKQSRPLNHYFIFRGPMGRLAYAVGSRVRPEIQRLFGAKPGLQPMQV